MAKAFLKLDTRRPLKDGTYMVRVGVGYGTDLYLSTGISVDRAYWDDRAKLYTGKSAKRINDTLAAILIRINNTILDLREKGVFEHMTKAAIKAALTGSETPEPNANTLGYLFEKVIATKGPRTAEIYQATLKKLTDWRDDIYAVRFDQITKMWLNEFCASLEGLAINTKSIHLRNLRNVVNYAIDENITQNYPFRNFHIPSEETPMRALTLDEFRRIRDVKLSTAFDQEHRAVFLLMFYLVGINIIDLSRLTADSIVRGRLEYRRAKTGKLYSIKLEPEAKAILRAYAGTSHLIRVFDRYANYKDYAQHLNAFLGRIVPGVTSYWARYSWATFAAELDIPKDTISEALGHEYGSRITGVYIKFSRDKIDAANRRVLNYIK